MKVSTNKVLVKLFELLFNPIIQMAEKFDYKNFLEFERILNEAFEKEFSQLDDESNQKKFTEVLSNIDYTDIQQQLKEYLISKYEKIVSKDTRAYLFLKLIDEAEKVIPNCTIALLMRIHPMTLLKRSLEPLDLHFDIKNNKGQHRARLTLRYFREISELLYENYAKMIWELTSIVGNNKEIDSTMSFGQTINLLKEPLQEYKLDNLIDYDAGWIRNSASHGKYYYKMDEDILVMWDRKKPKVKIKVNTLIKKAENMYSISSQILFDIYVYTIFNFIEKNSILEKIDKYKYEMLVMNAKSLISFQNELDDLFKAVKTIIIKR